MKRLHEESKKTQEEKISFQEGLKIVKSIQEKIEKINKTKSTHHSSYEILSRQLY